MKAIAQHASQQGTSMVEVLTAMVILATLAVGMGGYLFMNQAALSLQRDKRVALEIANGRMEELRALSFGSLTAMLPGTNYNTHYFYKAGPQTWSNSALPYFESTNVNGAVASMLTGIRLTGPSNYLDMAVSVSFTRDNNPSNQIALETFYYAP